MEAHRIIDTIKAMIQHPRYARKTIGIISMLGDAQALHIQSLLHKEIPGVEIEKRRIQAGISGEFQGDERDIMFLSMVDSASSEGTLRATGDGAFELIKKRYNVAASRARDQLWVMHSFDPDLHLKTSDLRLKLLQHVRDPLASLRAYNQEVGKTESPFEREVLKRLTDAGFKVKSQWQVGYYRIDMVIEGGGKRLALECDGDRYHPMEKLADDMERQSILERLGWQFVRIRGSAFYRNPELAMRPVFDRLGELDIPPEANIDEPQSSDMTLIHELDELIRDGFADDGAGGEMSVETADSVLREFGLGGDSVASIEFNHGQVEAMLGRFGGAVPLETFLRDFAKAKGFRRLGRNVRKGLETELEMLSRKGKISIKGGVIQLL